MTRVIGSILFSAFAAGGAGLAASQPVVLQTPGGSLYGTLEVPAGGGPFPVALIHAGSGPTDRDGNSPLFGKNDSLKMLAEGLAANGIASLRYDKRGIAASAAAAPSEADLRFDTYVGDAAAWLDFLAKDPRFGKRVVVGHSEGSLIGMLAAERSKADGFVSLAGAGQNGGDIILEQLRANPANPAALVEESARIVAELKAGRTVAQPSPLLAALFRPSVQPYLVSWFRYTPAQEIAKLTLPVLIVQGTTDLQVATKEADLLAAANAKAKKVLVEGMNHVLKLAPADPQANLAAYSNPALPLAPGLLDAVVGFIKGL